MVSMSRRLQARVDEEFAAAFEAYCDEQDMNKSDAIEQAVRLQMAIDEGSSTLVDALSSDNGLSFESSPTEDSDEVEEESEYEQYTIETAPPLNPDEAAFEDSDVVSHSPSSRLPVLAGIVRWKQDREDVSNFSEDELLNLVQDVFLTSEATAEQYVERMSKKGIVHPHVTVSSYFDDELETVKRKSAEYYRDLAENVEGDGTIQTAKSRALRYSKAQSWTDLSSRVSDDSGFYDGWFEATRKYFVDEEIAQSASRAALSNAVSEATEQGRFPSRLVTIYMVNAAMKHDYVGSRYADELLDEHPEFAQDNDAVHWPESFMMAEDDASDDSGEKSLDEIAAKIKSDA